MEQVKLLSMTGLLTLLIWAGADSLVNEVVSLRVALRIAPESNPDLLIDLDSESGTRLIQIQVSGPRKIIAELREHEPLSATLRIGDKPTGSNTLVLDRDTLKGALRADWKAFDRLSVLSVEPPTITVIADHMVSRELDLVLNQLTLAYDKAPKPAHLFTTLRVRESRLAALPRADLQSRIDISREVEQLLRGKPSGENVTVTVLLDSRVYGSDATLSPNQIDVEAVVKSDRVEARVPTVPIKLVVSFANLPKSFQAVDKDDNAMTLVTQTIEVVGPAEDVARLVSGETRAYGFIQLKQSDLEQLDVVRAWTPEFYLPPGITPAQPPQPVEFKLREAKAGGSTG